MTGRSWLASTSGTRPETRTASCSAEMKRRVRYSGRISTYCFNVATPALPTLSASQRSDRGKGFRRIERCAFRELDQDVDRIGTVKFGIETMACSDCLLPVGYLVGKAIARFKIGVDQTQTADNPNAEQAVEPGTVHHSRGNPSAKTPEHVYGSVRPFYFCHKHRFLSHQQNTEQRHKHKNREHGDQGCDEAYFAERPKQIGL